MATDSMSKLHQRQREQERQRLRELEAKDLDVETRRGPRPLEGFAGGHTTWTGKQLDEDTAAEEPGAEARRSPSESEARGTRLEAPDPEGR